MSVSATSGNSQMTGVQTITATLPSNNYAGCQEPDTEFARQTRSKLVSPVPTVLGMVHARTHSAIETLRRSDLRDPQEALGQFRTAREATKTFSKREKAAALGLRAEQNNHLASVVRDVRQSGSPEQVLCLNTFLNALRPQDGLGPHHAAPALVEPGLRRAASERSDEAKKVAFATEATYHELPAPDDSSTESGRNAAATNRLPKFRSAKDGKTKTLAARADRAVGAALRFLGKSA